MNEFYQSRILPIAVHGFCVLRRSAEPMPRFYAEPVLRGSGG
jgi:hypothetical protein